MSAIAEEAGFQCQLGSLLISINSHAINRCHLHAHWKIGLGWLRYILAFVLVLGEE